MMMTRRLAAVAAAMVTMAMGGARAEATFLLGTTVTSPGISFAGNGPFGFSNGSTAVVSDPAVEFTFADIANIDTFNFSDLGLTVTDNTIAQGASRFSASFTDAAFLGASVSGASAGFDGLTASISGSTLTVTSSVVVNRAQIRSASFVITPASTPVTATPEPSTLAGLGVGAVALAGVRLARRRRRPSPMQA